MIRSEFGIVPSESWSFYFWFSLGFLILMMRKTHDFLINRSIFSFNEIETWALFKLKSALFPLIPNNKTKHDTLSNWVDWNNEWHMIWVVCLILVQLFYIDFLSPMTVFIEKKIEIGTESFGRRKWWHFNRICGLNGITNHITRWWWR